MTNKSGTSWHFFKSKKKTQVGAQSRSRATSVAPASKKRRNMALDTSTSRDAIQRHPEKRLVLLGTAGVGKTCLAFKYVHCSLLSDPYLVAHQKVNGSALGEDQSTVSSANDTSSVSNTETYHNVGASFTTMTPTSTSSMGAAAAVRGSVTFGITTTNTPLTPLHGSNGQQYDSSDQITPQQLLKYLKDYLMKHASSSTNAAPATDSADTSTPTKPSVTFTSQDNAAATNSSSPSTPRSVKSTSSIHEEIDREMNPTFSPRQTTSTTAAPTLSTPESSLQYSRLVWFYQQLLHEYNEYQRFQLLQQQQQKSPSSPVGTGTKDIIAKHEQKLKREAKLLQQRLHEQNNFNQHLSADLKKFKKKLMTLQDKWMSERNEKLDLEMERDEQLANIKAMEKGFERILHMLHNDPSGKERRGSSTSSTQQHQHLLGDDTLTQSGMDASALDTNTTLEGLHTTAQTQRMSQDYELPHQKQYMEQQMSQLPQNQNTTSGGNTDETSPLSPLSAIGTTNDQNSTHSSHTTDTITLPHSNSHPNFASDSQSEDDDVSSTSSESTFSLSRQHSNGNVRKASSKQERLFCPPTKQLMTCVQIFNKQSPKAAINSLIRCGFIKDDPKAIAIFLVRCGSLDLKRLGEYLGDGKNLNVLHHYAHYQMERLLGRFPFDVALKAFVQSLNLPKEGQQVTRITEAFSDAYMEHLKMQQQQELDQQPSRRRSKRDTDGASMDIIKDADSAFLLACSILMLNVDLHSGKTNRPPMSREQFVSLFNDDEIPHIYLKRLYENVKENEWKDISPNADDSEDLYPPEVEQESTVLPMVKSSGNFQASDDQQLKTSLSLSSLVDSPTGSAPPAVQSRDRSMTKPSPISRTGRLRTRSVHQRQKSKSFDMQIHSRQDIPLYFSLREFSKRSIHTFQIRDTMSIEWATMPPPLSSSDIPKNPNVNPLRFPVETERQIHRGDFFLCLYNTRNRSSFAAIEHIVNYIVKARPKESKSALLDQMMIVAIDFNDDESQESRLSRREITKEEGQRLALEIGAPFMSVCILKDQDVKQVFRTAVHYCLRPVSRHMNSMYRQMGLGAGNVSEQIHEHYDNSIGSSGGQNSRLRGDGSSRSGSGESTYLSFEVSKERHEIENSVVDTVFYVS